MFCALLFRRPLPTLILGAVITEIIVGSVILGCVCEGGVLPKGVRFGFYKTNEKEG